MNVIIICLDSLRWDYVGYNGNDWVRTPAIDAFERRAICFDRAYCASFPTIPMRTDCFTGNINWPRYGWKPLGKDEVTLLQCLREAGYYTGLILDTKHMIEADFQRDFDEYEFITKPVDDGVKPEDIKLPFPRENVRQNGEEYIGNMVLMSDYRHETDWFVARTMMRAGEWLEDNYKREKFFLWVDTFEIHEVWYAPNYYTEYYSPNYEGIDYSFPNYGYTDVYSEKELGRLRARYAAEITLTDKWVGHLLRQIEEMDLLKNTMVILLSDHGISIGEHHRAGKHTVDPNNPWPIYEEVSHIPLLISLPGHLSPKRISALVQPADLMPTILDACGIKGPRMYGRSWMPLMGGIADKHWENVFTTCYSWTGPGRITYLTSLITVTNPRWSLIVGPQPFQAELYDLWVDPKQEHNLIKKRPEIAKHLCKQLVDFMREQNAEEDYIKTYARV